MSGGFEVGIGDRQAHIQAHKNAEKHVSGTYNWPESLDFPRVLGVTLACTIQRAVPIY